MNTNATETIITNAKAILAANLTGFSQLDYEYTIEDNAESKMYQKYGFITRASDVINEGTLGSTQFHHQFQLILTTDFQNQDDDIKQRAAVNSLIKLALDMLQIFRTNRLGGKWVTGESIETPEFINDNKVAVIRLNLVVMYRISF